MNCFFIIFNSQFTALTSKLLFLWYAAKINAHEYFYSSYHSMALFFLNLPLQELTIFYLHMAFL